MLPSFFELAREPESKGYVAWKRELLVGNGVLTASMMYHVKARRVSGDKGKPLKERAIGSSRSTSLIKIIVAKIPPKMIAHLD